MTFAEIKETARLFFVAVGVVGSVCTVIGAPLAKWAGGKWGDFGHFLVAFGADLGKAKKRAAIVAAKTEKEPPL